MSQENPKLDFEWLTRFNQALSRHGHGIQTKIAEKCGVDDSTISKLKEGMGSLDVAVDASLYLEILPPVKWLPEPYHSIVHSVEEALRVAPPESVLDAITTVEKLAKELRMNPRPAVEPEPSKEPSKAHGPTKRHR